MRFWAVRLEGGAYDGWTGETEAEPKPILVAWLCHAECDGHATFDPHDERIVLRTAESYRRAEVDLDERLATYRIGELDPAGRMVEEEELELAGSVGEQHR